MCLKPASLFSYLRAASICLLAALPTAAVKADDPFGRIDLTAEPADDLRALPGQTRDSRQVRRFMALIGGAPAVDRYDDCYSLTWKDKGVSLVFTFQDTLDHVRVYGGDHPILTDYERFKGRPPYRLSFGDKRNDVEKRFGKPDSFNGNGNASWILYRWMGISINFDSKDPADKNPGIDDIAVFKPWRY